MAAISARVRDLVRKPVECVRGDASCLNGTMPDDDRASREHPLGLAAWWWPSGQAGERTCAAVKAFLW